jgi:Fungal specific transcription factor domain
MEDDFSNFVDSIGFPSNPFSPSYQPVPDWPSELPLITQAEASVSQRAHQNAPDALPEDFDVEATPWASRASSVQPQIREVSNEAPKRAARHSMPQVTPQCRAAMIEKLKVYSSFVPEEFTLPSRHTLTCFITGYFTIFNEHYPLLHLPTLRLESLSLELFLSIAALGAQYYWERTKGLELFRIALAITHKRLRGRAVSNDQLQTGHNAVLHAAQALILLIAVSTWSEAGKGEAFSLRSLLEELLHADALDVKVSASEDSWFDWKHYEETKRTKLIAYCLLNLHTITFDVAPIMLYRDINTDLACSENLWRADSEENWRQSKILESPGHSFVDAFQALFDGSTDDTNRPVTRSPLSGHTLIQAIIQHVWLLQQAGNMPTRQSLSSTAAATSVELALRRWRTSWEMEHEISSQDSPMPFTSRALLRLAYIRINIDSGSSRNIGSWNPHEIALSLRSQAPVQRNDKMTRAALHCAQGLGIPIKLGINFVAHTQVFYWSNQYALCSLECAQLLTKWLEAVTELNPDPGLNEKERRLLNFVLQLIQETEFDAPRERLLRNSKCLSIVILRLWAKLFRPDSVWDIVNLIGKSLTAYADLLECEVRQEVTGS